MGLKKNIHKLLIPCSEISFLLEKKIANKLSKIETLRLNIHLLCCKWCKSYNKKIVLMDDYLKSFHKKNEEQIKVSDDELAHLKEKVTNKLNI